MHNTGNPLPSKDILDLYDNSETIDNFVNSQQDEVPDRFGTKRLTLAGLIKRSMSLRNEINDFSGTLTFKPEWTDVPMNVSEGLGGESGALNLQAEALGNRSEVNKIHSREALRRTYEEIGLNLVAGSFEAGGTLESASDVLLLEESGKAYGWNGAFPKNVLENSVPSSDWSDMSKSVTAENVDAMKNGNFRTGQIVHTLGYYSPHDGGAASYKILSAGTVPPDGFGDHRLKSGLVAVLDTSKPPSIMQYGARPDVAYNNKAHVQSAINAGTKRYASTGDIQYVYSPPFRFEMGSVTESPRISMLSGVVLLSDGTKFKTASNSPIDSNWNANFLFGGLDTRISCINSGIKGLIYIDGNRQNNHPGDRDEKHSGIYISRDAENISFDDVVIEDPAGDGVVIAQLGFPYDRNAVPKNIKFKSLICRRAWRNGVSLIDYDNVHIDYLECTETNGTAPEAGLDIEPNYWEARARNLWIGHYVSKGNRGSGLDVLQHNNNSEQRAGTIGRFDSDGDGEIMRLFTCCGLSILDGVGKNATGTYCMEIGAAKDLRIRMDFLNNNGGVFGEITKGWVSEPDVDGSFHVVRYPSERWDFSGSTFRNNKLTQLSIKGVHGTDPLSGAPSIYKVIAPNLDGCYFDNGLVEGNQQATIHLNIQGDVERYSARNIIIANDAPHPHYLNAASTGRADFGSHSKCYYGISYPTIPANGHVTVTLEQTSTLGSYNELTVRSAQDLGGVIINGYVGIRGSINVRLINPTGSNISGGSTDFVLNSSFTL